MGVNIKDIVEGKNISFEDLSKKPLGFDAFNMIYQFLASIRQYDGTPLVDSKDRTTSHLSGLFYRNTKFLEAGIKPVYVFDGKPPKFKTDTIKERQERKRKAEKELDKARELDQWSEIKKKSQQTIKLNDEMIEESKKLLKAMGIPVVQAVGEGEAQAAQMAKEGYVYSAVSQDYDSLLFGAPKLIKNLSITGKRHHVRGGIIDIKPEELELEKILNTLNISREQLIWLGILVGTDYNSGVKGIGAKKGLKIVQECRNIDDVMKIVKEKKDYVFDEDIESITEYFLNPPATKDFNLKWDEANEKSIIQILVDEHDFSYDRVESTIKKLKNCQTEINKQAAISDFM